MKKSLGLVEVAGLCAAVYTADAMVKAANVELIALERARGNGWMTVKVIGDVGAVKAAVNVGVQVASSNGKLITSRVIARPANEVDKAFVEADQKKEQAAAARKAAEEAAVEKAAAEKAVAEKAAAEKAAAEKAAAEKAAAEKAAAEKAAAEKAAAEKAAAEKAAAEKAAAEKAAAEEQANEEKSGSQAAGAAKGEPAAHTKTGTASKAAVLPKNNTTARRTKKKKS